MPSCESVNPFGGIPKPMVIAPFTFFENFQENGTVESTLVSVMEWLNEEEYRSATVTRYFIFLNETGPSFPVEATRS